MHVRSRQLVWQPSVALVEKTGHGGVHSHFPAARGGRIGLVAVERGLSRDENEHHEYQNAEKISVCDCRLEGSHVWRLLITPVETCKRAYQPRTP